MSEEFIKVATQEINDELSAIAIILDSCQDDGDISKNSDKIERHLHKIKGLAPMMGKENVGALAKTLDLILKKITSGLSVPGFFESLCISIQQMTLAMKRHHDLSGIQRQVSDTASKIID